MTTYIPSGNDSGMWTRAIRCSQDFLSRINTLSKIDPFLGTQLEAQCFLLFASVYV